MCKTILTAIISLTISLSALTQAATYGGGSGTQANPYQIWTHQQMNTIGANSSDWGKSFKFDGWYRYVCLYRVRQYKISAIQRVKFTGTFDGNGHILSNLTYNTDTTISYIGLFGCTYNSTIKKTGLKNVSLSSRGNYVGGLVGDNEGSITACYVTGSVSGYSQVGGFGWI